MNDKEVSDIQRFLVSGEAILSTLTYERGLGDNYPVVDEAMYHGWRTQVLNYLKSKLSEGNHYYTGFKSSVRAGANYPSNVNKGIIILKNMIEDINNEILNITETSSIKEVVAKVKSNEIFIVHGHDNLALTQVARYLERLNFKPIILHEQSNSGRTIIEKIENYTNVGFAVVLYTQCDVGGKDRDNLQPRARQNVVFEHGYLIGKIGRNNVCALIKGTVEAPGDISGVVYTPMDDNEGWHFRLAKELKASGYTIDINQL